MTASFPSTRFPSLQPDPRDASDGGPRTHDDVMRAPAWRISAADHTVIKNRLEEFSSVLPNDFVFPSRHTLTRFLEGYINGFHEHLPFLHLPTLSPTEFSPELLLAVLAVGAQYRFESHRGHALWYAAKPSPSSRYGAATATRCTACCPLLPRTAPHSTRPSPSAGYRHSFNAVHQERPMTQDTHREPYSPEHAAVPPGNDPDPAPAVRRRPLGRQGHPARGPVSPEVSWPSCSARRVWYPNPHRASTGTRGIRIEGSTRTKLIAYCFFNLCSIAYNTPPMLLTSEMSLLLPNPSRLWRAETAWQWQEARQSLPTMETPFQDAFSRLLNRPSQGPLSHVSSLGHYVLIHAFIQHIYLLKQTSFATASPFEANNGLKAEDVEQVSQSLRTWQIGFEQKRHLRAAETGQTAGLDSSAVGAIAFNSTALVRLAYIRLYTDVSPSRTLESRDHILIANGFNDAPLLGRNPRLTRAILQAVHALSMLVKAGVNYVATTKSREWSMQHSRKYTQLPPRVTACSRCAKPLRGRVS